MNNELLYLSKDDIGKVDLPMGMIIDLLEKAFAEKGKGNCEMPPKPGIHPKKDAFYPCHACLYSSFTFCRDQVGGWFS